MTTQEEDGSSLKTLRRIPKAASGGRIALAEL
jgi:hypothetical protein